MKRDPGTGLLRTGAGDASFNWPPVRLADPLDMAMTMTGMTRIREQSTVAAASIGMALCIIPVFLGTFPLFLNAFALHDRDIVAVFPALLLLSTCVSAIGNIFSGWLVDHHGAKRVAVPGVLCFGLAVAALSLTDRAGIMRFPLYALLGVAAAFTGPVVFAKAISGLVHIRRGVAFGIAITAAPMLSAAILAPITQSLIGAFGWQHAYLALGGIVIVIGVPVVWLFLWESPAAAAPGPMASPSPPPLPVGDALLDSRFLLVTLAISASALVATGTAAFLLPIAQNDGISQTVAVWTVALFSLGALIGAMLSSALIDQANRPIILLPCFAVSLCGATLVYVSHAPALFLIGGALLGAGHYGGQALLPYVMSRYFGVARLGQIFGTCAAAVSISASFGPVAIGIARSQDVSFPRILVGAIVLLVIGASMIPWLRAFPARGLATPPVPPGS